MKKHLFNIVFIITISLITFSCENLVENRITVRNLAQDQVTLVVQGKSYNIDASTEIVLNDFNRGDFPYVTLFDLPNGASALAEENDTIGNFVLIGGTQILLVYTSKLEAGTYTLKGTLTSSDSDTRVNPFQ
jgi:hypothetical protein